MKKISLKLVGCSKDPEIYNVLLTNEDNLLAVKVYRKLNNSSSLIDIIEEESLLYHFREKAIELLKQKGFKINHVINVYWIHCISPQGKEVCYELKLT